MYVLDLADRLISKAGPFAAAGIMVGSIYWTAVTYGAVTVMQVRRAVVGGRRDHVSDGPVCSAGGGSQGGSGRDGAGRPAVPAHRPAHHPRHADPREDDPLGGLRPAPVEEVLKQAADPQQHLPRSGALHPPPTVFEAAAWRSLLP